MHMVNALLTPAVAATMYVTSGSAVGVSAHKLKKDETIAKLPTMAAAAALVFAGQMINYTIPGTGSSGHLCGGMLLSALLGPWAGFLSMAIILTLQCLVFADGGLMALGANIWNMAFYGCFVGYYLVWKPLMQSRLGGESRGAARSKIVLASVLGSVFTLQLGAFSVVLETSLSGVTNLPFGAFCSLMQPIHLAIGLIEGLITSAVLLFVYEARPELLQDVPVGDKLKNRISLKSTIVVLSAMAVVIGGGLSLLASQSPDGLEWALTGLTGQAEYDGLHNVVADAAEQIQSRTALLPDYAFAGSDSALGTSVSGVVGAALVAAVAVAVSFLGGFFRKKTTKT